MKYREVFNEETGMYRVEQRGLFGWSFVTELDSGDYKNFNSHEEANSWLCKNTKRNSNRRWRIIDACSSTNKTNS